MTKLLLVSMLTIAGVVSRCGSSLAAPAGATGSPGAAAGGNSVSGSAVVETALKYVGYRYSTAGNTPKTGFSCIGFVSYVYGTLGIPLPDGLDQALAYAPPVPFSDLMPGDILYFQNTVWPGLSHAAIYLGGGRFIHAEWYNRGVRISSFNDDPLDGNYWIGKYLGANRPWEGPPGAAIVPPSPSPGPSSFPAITATTALGGTEGVVTVGALNVRSGPSRKYGVETVVREGTTLFVQGQSGGWVQVQLPGGTEGWVIASAISTGGATPPPAPATTQAAVTSAPLVAVPVPALRVHSAASITAPVVAVALQGQKLAIITRSGNWDRVRLPDGTIGWVSAPVLAGSPGTAAPVHRATTLVPLRVHSAPNLDARVIAVLPVGMSLQVLGSSRGWLTIRLAGGATGYVVARYVRVSSSA